jgi:hypothetical protein
VEKISPKELMDIWQKAFGELESKWHEQFLNSPYTHQILEYSKEEILKCFVNPMIITEYVGIYRERVNRPAKKLSEILIHLEAEGARLHRKPLGTHSTRIESTGSSSAVDGVHFSWDTFNPGHDDQ